MKKTVTHLADGRELIYFDDAGTPAGRYDDAPDRRELPPPPAVSRTTHGSRPRGIIPRWP